MQRNAWEQLYGNAYFSVTGCFFSVTFSRHWLHEYVSVCVFVGLNSIFHKNDQNHIFSKHQPSKAVVRHESQRADLVESMSFQRPACLHQTLVTGNQNMTRKVRYSSQMYVYATANHLPFATAARDYLWLRKNKWQSLMKIA